MPKLTYNKSPLRYRAIKGLLSCFFFLTLTITYCSCNKHAINNITINSALKANYNFQPGSYWIYRNTVSGDTDSFVVRSNEFTNYPGELNTDHNNYDYINIIINIYKGPMYVDTTLWELVLHENYISFGGVKNVCIYPFVNGSVSSDIFSDITNYAISIYTPYKINNLSFDSVLEVHCTSDYVNDTFFVTNNALMAKMMFNDNAGYRAYELLRYHIVR